jgi:hypothetical protein
MSSIVKIESARANGARSRGPVSPEGRARSSKNAIKHGLSSSAIVLSNESESEFEKLLESYRVQFNPQSEIEASLVEQLVAARWRMERIWAIETALLDLEMVEQEDAVDQKYETIDEVARTALAFRALCDNSRALDLLSRYESRFRRAGERILDSLLRLQDQPLENKRLQNEPNNLPTRVSGDEPEIENEELQNEPNHPITRVPEDDPQPPADFTPSNSIPPDPDDFSATIHLLPQASINTPSPTAVVSVSPAARSWEAGLNPPAGLKPTLQHRGKITANACGTAKAVVYPRRSLPGRRCLREAAPGLGTPGTGSGSRAVCVR